MGEVYLPETPEMIALREQIQRDEEELAEIREALARFPQAVLDQVALAAQQPKQYGFREFVAYMRSWMTARNLFHGVHIASWLYGLYLSKYIEAHPDESSGGGEWLGGASWASHTPQMAPAGGRGSVVDAVFAKAERQAWRAA
jgi:hypothetical protein